MKHLLQIIIVSSPGIPFAVFMGFHHHIPPSHGIHGMGLATLAHRIWAVDYCIGSNFWKFYLIKTSFILDEPVSLVKVFGLFRLAWIVLVFRLWSQ
jgi:hypothetical protein